MSQVEQRQARRLFTLQLATLLQAQVHIVTALEVLEKQLHPSLLASVVRIRRAVDGGDKLSHAVRATGLFPPFYVALLEVAEQTGRLSAVLGALADWEERDAALRRQAASAMAYPLTVLTVTLALTLSLIYFVLPGFFSMFAQLHDLPAPTRVLLAVSDFLHSPALLFFLGAVGLAVRQLFLFCKTEEGRRWGWTQALATPALGRCLQAMTLARYALAMTILGEGGVGTVDSCDLAAQASGNPLLEEDARRLRSGIEAGSSHSGYLQQHPEVWPRIFVQMVRVGEESGRGPQIFARLAGIYEEETLVRTRLLIQLSEPLMLLILGGTIGGILVSIFLPLYGMLHGVQG